MLRAVAPGENVIQVGEDVKRRRSHAGSAATRSDRRTWAAWLRSGITRVSCRPQLRVGIVSGGDELVDPELEPGPGQIRDINSYTLAALVRRAGHEPWLVGVVPDDLEALDRGRRTGPGVVRSW